MPTLGTGSDIPIGPSIASEDVYVQSGPDIWFQDATATEENSPDSDGFYWGLSGTAAYPVFPLGCYDDLTMNDARTSNDIMCAAIGRVAIAQQRDAFEIALTFKQPLPFEKLRHLIGGGAVTHNVAEETSKFGLGPLPINQFYHLHFDRVYDEDAGDYIAITFHKVQFTDASPLTMAYGKEWTWGIKAVALADTTKPKAQRFATVLRWDPSVL